MIGPATKVSLGTILGFIGGAIAALWIYNQWDAARTKQISDAATAATLAQQQLDQARADIVAIYHWQVAHTDFSNEAVRALNNNFETLRLGNIQALEYLQRDARTKGLVPPNIPSRLYSPMLIPSRATPGNGDDGAPMLP
jgi:hypothetical protein